MMPWYWRIEYQWMRFVRWVESWTPIQCSNCRRWNRWKKMRLVEHRIAGYVLICPACVRELYREEAE